MPSRDQPFMAHDPVALLLLSLAGLIATPLLARRVWGQDAVPLPDSRNYGSARRGCRLHGLGGPSRYVHLGSLASALLR